MRIILPILLALFAQNAAADGCPVALDHSVAVDKIYTELQLAPNQMTAIPYSNQLWELWLEAPDMPSQLMLDEGLRAIRVGDYARAIDRLKALVSYCPFYAEGYNQRAFVNFLRKDYKAALPDLDQAISLNPRHTGALTGKARTLIELGEDDEAQVILKMAVALNPWLGERALLR